MLRRAVFLDRDGVLVEAKVIGGKPYPAALDSLKVAGSAPEDLARLRAAGLLLLVVTNQPDIRRGSVSKESVDRIHARLLVELPLDGIYACPHDDVDDCPCRKPRPGLLIQAADEHGVDLKGSFMIGDRWRDVDAGANAGCQTVLIDFDYAEQSPKNAPDAVVSSLTDAVDWILSR